MKLNGDPEGIEELKEMMKTRMDYLKYLVTEAKTNFDNAAHFKNRDGSKKYKLIYQPRTGEFQVEKED